MRIANALGEMGPTAATDQPALLMAARMREVEGAVPGLLAYVKDGGDRKLATSKLLQRIRTASEDSDHVACQALAHIGAKGHDVIEALQDRGATATAPPAEIRWVRPRALQE